MKSIYESNEHLMKMFPDVNQHNQPEASYVSHGLWYCTKDQTSPEKPANKLNLNFSKKRKKKSS